VADDKASSRLSRQAPIFESTTLVCPSLADAIPCVLQLVNDRGRPAYVRGELNLEVLGADIVIVDPTDRLPIVPGRRPITAFCIMEFLWYCAQRTNLNSLEAYAPRIRSYFGGIQNTTGSDYGRQIFGKINHRSQWENVITLLKTDPGSKRAYIAVYNAAEVSTLLPENPDIACTIGFQALIRNEQLNWVTTMRANDAYRGFVSDTFSFTMFQELLAETLGIKVGQYLHRPTSLHTFPEDKDAIDIILRIQRGAHPLGLMVERMPSIQANAFWSHLSDFWTIHDYSRLTGKWNSLRSLHDLKNDWWQWVADVLLKFHEINHTDG
jgi:thymidylate synthase